MQEIIPGNGNISRADNGGGKKWFYSGQDLFFPAVGINQAYPCSISNQVQGTLKIKLVHDIGAVVVHGFRADEKFVSDLLGVTGLSRR